MPREDVELGYFASPDSGPNPGIVMVHDVWGLSDHTRDLARRLAQEGFAVLALDLYRREDEVKIENPGEWMRALSDPQVLADVQAGVDFLKQHPGTADRSVGVTGFCMGGMYALLAACGCEGLSAAVPFYGLLSHEHGILHAEEGVDPALKPRQPVDAARDLSCPLLAFFGEDDEFIPASDVDTLRERLKQVSVSSELVVYPGCGHAFMNDTRPEAYRPETAELAWGRMLAFFRHQLA